MFLSRDEIKELTGYIRSSDQVKFLAKNKIPFTTDKSLRPLVLRDFIMQYLGFKSKTEAPKKAPELNPVPQYKRRKNES